MRAALLATAAGLLAAGCAAPHRIVTQPTDIVVGYSAAQLPDLALQKQRAFEAQSRGDYQTAWNLLLPVAESGDADAQYQMGWLSEEGWGGTPGDSVRAADWYRRAAAQGKLQAQLWLGYHLAGRMSRGASLEGSAAEMQEGIEWLTLASEQGSVEAQLVLGDLYWSGSGHIAKDRERARLWYQQAADQGNPMAQIMLRMK